MSHDMLTDKIFEWRQQFLLRATSSSTAATGSTSRLRIGDAADQSTKHRSRSMIDGDTDSRKPRTSAAVDSGFARHHRSMRKDTSPPARHAAGSTGTRSSKDHHPAGEKSRHSSRITTAAAASASASATAVRKSGERNRSVSPAQRHGDATASPPSDLPKKAINLSNLSAHVSALCYYSVLRSLLPFMSRSCACYTVGLEKLGQVTERAQEGCCSY